MLRYIWAGLGVVLVGCAAAPSDGSASESGQADTAFAPRQGVYEWTDSIIQEDTCGFRAQASQEYVTQASATGYTRTIAFANASTSQPEQFLAHTAKASTSSQIDMAADAHIAWSGDVVDAWSGDASFVRTQTETYSCEGGGCTSAPASNLGGLINDGAMPCHVTRVARLSLAHCNNYPFRYVRPDATTVWVSGSFNNWATKPEDGALVMTRGDDGLWSLDANLPAGPHQYKFITDGSQIFDTDMANPLRTDDGAGGWNSIANCQ